MERDAVENKDKLRILELSIKALEEEINESEAKELERYVSSSKAMAAYYRLSIDTHQFLTERHNPIHQGKHAERGFLFTDLIHPERLLNSENILDMAVWKDLSEYERVAQAIEISVNQTHQQEEPVKISAKPWEKRKISKFNIFTLVTSAAILVFSVLLMKLTPPAGGVLVGSLTRSADAQWESACGDIAAGSELRVGPLKLVKGLAEIQFEDGASVILEAPVEFTLESPRQMHITRGKAVANIHGANTKTFVIRSPYGTVVDYGTEFGVQVSPGEIKTHVFQGSVALRDGDDPVKFSETLNLHAGEGGQITSNSKPEKVKFNSSTFIRCDEFDARHKASNGSPYHRWLAYSCRLRRDPDLVAYYTFEKDAVSPSLIANQAEATKGLFIGDMNEIPEQRRPTWTSGRWPQKEALQFARPKAQYLKIKGGTELYQSGPITLAAWIKCPGTEDGSHILSNRIENLGACNYQFGYKTRRPDGYDVEYPNMIQLARKKTKEDGQQVYSPVLEADSGWIFVAVTHDNHTVSFYRNGKLIQSLPWEIHQEPVEADLWIGSDGTESYIDRYFNGTIGELMILKRALDWNDILAMYESGRP